MALYALALFVLYIPIYGMCLIYTARHFHMYSLKKYSISQLGCRKSEKYLFFNRATFIYGLLAVFASLAFSFNKLVSSYMILGASIMLIALFPADTHKRLHDFFGSTLFISSLAISAISFSLYPSLLFISVSLTVFALLFFFDIVRFIIQKRKRAINWRLEWAWVLIMNIHSLGLALLTLDRSFFSPGA
jgi:hypothetical membrane protein